MPELDLDFERRIAVNQLLVLFVYEPGLRDVSEVAAGEEHAILIMVCIFTRTPLIARKVILLVITTVSRRCCFGQPSFSLLEAVRLQAWLQSAPFQERVAAC